MPLDLYADEIVPASTARKQSAVSKWLPVAAIAVVLGLAVWCWPVSVDPSPDPQPGPPVPTAGLHVLIVEETADRAQLSAGQVAIFSSIPLREFYAANCEKEADGKPAYRSYDKDDRLDKESEKWKALRASLTLQPPAVLLVAGKRGEQFKLPPSPEALIEQINRFKHNSK